MSTENNNDPEELLTITDLASKSGSSISFIRYAIDAGCPTKNGKLSHAMLIEWLTVYYNDFRGLAGLPLLKSHLGLEKNAAAKIQVDNMLLTLSDFIASRSSDQEIQNAGKYASDLIRGLK